MHKPLTIKTPIAVNVLSALAVAVFGFILLNLAFLFDFLFQSLIDSIVKLFVPANINTELDWFPPLKHILFVALIFLISFPILNSKLTVLYKAIYMTVPLAAIFVTIGIFLHPWPLAVYGISSLFTIITLYFFYKTRKPWLYYYSLLLVALTLSIFSLLGGEI